MAKFGAPLEVNRLIDEFKIHATLAEEANKKSPLHSMNGDNIIYVDLNDIEEHPENVEIYGEIKTDDLDKSIAERGVEQPIVLCKGTTKRYRCLCGHRRLFSSRKEGVQKEYELLHNGEKLAAIKAFDKGELSEAEQMKTLLQTNIMRVKTFFNIVQESKKDMEILSAEKAENQRKGIAVEKTGLTKDVIGQKYFGVGHTTYSRILKIYDILREQPNHPVIKQLDGSVPSSKKIEWEKVLKKLTKPEDEKRVDSGMPKKDVMEFHRNLKDIDFDLSRIQSKADAVNAYLCLSKMARDAKSLVKKLK